MADNGAGRSRPLPILAIACQVHFAFVLLAPLMLVPIGYLIRERDWRALSASVALAAITTIPYLVHLVQTDWLDVRILRDLTGSAAQFDASGPALVMSWATSWDTWYLEFVHLDRLCPVDHHCYVLPADRAGWSRPGRCPRGRVAFGQVASAARYSFDRSCSGCSFRLS